MLAPGKKRSDAPGIRLKKYRPGPIKVKFEFCYLSSKRIKCKIKRPELRALFGSLVFGLLVNRSFIIWWHCKCSFSGP